MKETFDFIEVPLPACFDLSKPYQSTCDEQSIRVRISIDLDTEFQFSFFFSQVFFSHVRFPLKHNQNHYSNECKVYMTQTVIVFQSS